MTDRMKVIMDASGLTYTECRFPKPPTDSTFAVYDRRCTRGGPDTNPMLRRTDATVYVYGRLPAEIETAEEAMEKALDASFNKLIEGWEKSSRQWINDVQIFCTIYSFSFNDK